MDATHRRSTSAPYLLTIFSAASLPLDLESARPSPSSVQPLVAVARYGAAPFRATPTSSELWNQPRYWSPPSRYMSAGQGREFCGVSTARWLTPESNHTSRMSVSLRKDAPPHFPHFAPGPASSAAVWEYHTST